jgi:serine/threonine protein kinase
MRESPVPADDNGAAPTTKKHSLVDLSTFDGTYKLHEILGTGAFSVVRAAVHRQTNEKVAVKIISKAGLPADDEKDLRKEVRADLLPMC